MQLYITFEDRHWAKNGKSDNEEIASYDYTLHPSVYEGRDSNGATVWDGGWERRDEHTEYRGFVDKETTPCDTVLL